MYEIPEGLLERAIINVLDERINRARLAIRTGKHTKRIAHTKKILTILECARDSYDLPTRLEGSD